jgi:hypothetical protein
LTDLTPAQAGLYSVAVENQFGTASSVSVRLSLQEVNTYAGLTIIGGVGSPYRVEFRDEVSNTNDWMTLTNFVLPTSPYLFIDRDSANQHKRFYRAVSVP